MKRKHPGISRAIIFSIISLVMLGASCSTPQDGGLFRSLDNGDTWEARNYISKEGRRTLTIANVNVSEIVFHPEDSNVMFLGTKGNGIYVTVDAGEHWTQGQIASGNIYAIAIDPVDPQIMYVAKDTSIMKSSDSGKTWDTVFTDIKGAKINTIAIDSFDDRRVYAGTSAGAIFKSFDYGLNWDLRMQIDEPILEILIPKYNTRILYVLSADAQIYKSVTHGEPNDPEKADDVNSGWKMVMTDEIRDAFDGPLDTYDIILDPNDETVLYAATKRGLMRGSAEGTSWQDVPTLIGFNEGQNEQIRNISIPADNPNIIYFTVQRVIHRSTDAGKTWSVVENFPSTRLITKLVIDPEVTTVLYAGTEQVEKQKGLIKK